MNFGAFEYSQTAQVESYHVFLIGSKMIIKGNYDNNGHNPTFEQILKEFRLTLSKVRGSF